jgi:hypothetical protein
VHCWSRFLPAFLKNVRGLYTQISAGKSFICGVMTDGRISCNGQSKGALDYPTNHGEKFVQISCSFDYCCALDASGHVQCWGGPHDPHVITPPKVHTTVGLDGKSSKVHIFFYVPSIFCLLFCTIFCNIFLILHMFIQEFKSSYKKRAAEEEEEEEEILGTKHIEEAEFKQISVGFEFACGISYVEGDLICWGEFKRVKNLLRHAVKGPFKQVSVGKLGVCAIRAEDGSLQCFGQALDSRMALNPPPEDTHFDQIKVGFLQMCAVDLDSQLYCWGGQAKSSYDIVVA